MNNNCICTLAIGELDYFNYSLQTFQHYARKTNSDFILIRERTHNDFTIHFEKYQVVKLLEKYEQVLFVDADIIIAKKSPNIFQFREILLKKNLFIATGEPATKNHIGNGNWGGHDFPYIERKFGKITYNTSVPYINSGFFLLNKSHIKLFENLRDSEYYFRTHRHLFHDFGEQTFLNYFIIKNKINLSLIDHKWNDIWKRRKDSYFIHYGALEHFIPIKKIDEIRKDFPNLKENKDWMTLPTININS